MRWIFFIAVISLFSCRKEAKIPIPEEKMAKVLKDMLFAEAAMNRVSRSMEDSVQKQYYQQIYQIHDIDSTQLANTFKMMQDDPKLAESLYAKAETLLVDAEAAAKAEKEKEKEKDDKSKKTAKK